MLSFIVGAILLSPGVARAHAAFVSSQPAPGEKLASAPAGVELRFTEPLNLSLSRAVVIDPSGQRFEAKPTDEGAIVVPLATTAPGVYEVSWTTVSTVDGHTLRGTFRFGVGVAPGEGAEGTIGFGPQRNDLLTAVARALEYGALFTAVGMLLLRHLARRKPELLWVRVPVQVPLAIALVAGLAVVLGETFTAASPSAGALANYLSTGLPGVARSSRLAAEALALWGLVAAPRLVAVPVGTALVALAAAGHAAAIRPTWWGVGVDAVHLATAGLWAGGILALATLRPPDGWRGPDARRLLDRFSPVALTAFLVTVGTGVLRGFQELGAFSDLVTSSYGRVLGLKVIAVIAMIPLSLLAWRRLVRSPRLEAGVAVSVIGLAALLAAYPLPPARVSEAEAAQEVTSSGAALPRPGDLTLADNAGEVLVGLTLRPGTPGPNEALVYLLPLEGEDAATGIAAELSVDGRSLTMRECGPTCRSAEVQVVGGERLEVHVAGEAGGTATFALPELPAPTGRALLAQAQNGMRHLRTLRLDETFSSGRTIVRSTYAFQAPDRMRIEVDTGFQSVWVGATRYRRDEPDDPWEKEEGLTRTRVPFFIWDTDRVIAPRVLGRERVDGRATQVLSFFAAAGSFPVWHRLWVDSGGLVLNAEMRTQGHFMDHRYYAFDGPFTIRAP